MFIYFFIFCQHQISHLIFTLCPSGPESRVMALLAEMRLSPIISIPQHWYTPPPLSKWWNHDLVMKKSHTSVLSGAAGVIKEDWWKQVIPPWFQATEGKVETPLSATSAPLFLSSRLLHPPPSCSLCISVFSSHHDTHVPFSKRLLHFVYLYLPLCGSVQLW